MTNSLSFEDLCQAGREHLKNGRLPEALAAFEEARLINDLDADVHDGLATAHFLLKDDAAAAKHFERVTRLDPRRGPAWINLGAVYNRLREYQKAAEHRRQRGTVRPGVEQRARQAARRAGDSEAQENRAVDVPPEPPEAHSGA